MISSLHISDDLNQHPMIYGDIKGKGKAKVKPEEEILMDDKGDELFYRSFKNEEEDLAGMMRLVAEELSEPYNVYTFRYFLIDWPHLSFLVFPTPQSKDSIATIVCKQDSHRGKTNRGYIAMLSVDKAWRRRGIASKLVQLAIKEMAQRGANEVVLETEFDNAPSLSLYDRLGFLREKRLHRFYSNHKDAFRLILPIETDPPARQETESEAEEGRWNVGAGPGLDPINEAEENPPKYFTEGDPAGTHTPRPPPKPLEDWGMYT
ncbi:uncharacterized protein IL334_000149 [Kwoniella shivajii]|uniref:N-acetyltransferase domain-containing protein n=1 Tax=Kwoniella shivajii TaxID=564305 RepID=A0ABZ1CRD8_9TREE|nr:hypothetical protein IL334_000149 [Kwoniella shivajii]